MSFVCLLARVSFTLLMYQRHVFALMPPFVVAVSLLCPFYLLDNFTLCRRSNYVKSRRMLRIGNQETRRMQSEYRNNVY